MSKKNLFTGLIFMGSLMLFQSDLPAEMIMGKVIIGKVYHVDLPKQRLSVAEEHPVSGRINYLNIFLDPETRHFGIVSLENLKIGDLVMIEIVQDAESGKWKANALGIGDIFERDNSKTKRAHEQREENQKTSTYVPQISILF